MTFCRFLRTLREGAISRGSAFLEVAEHYYHFGGKSPINDQCRDLISALRDQAELPIYWGNRNWEPLLPDAIRQMRDDGIKHALAFITSAYSSYSGCRQYRENLIAARAEVEGAPVIDKLRVFYNHPGFIGKLAPNRVHRAMPSPGSGKITRRPARLVGDGPCLFRVRSRKPATTRSNLLKRRDWWLRLKTFKSGIWCFRAAAVRLDSHGSNLTFWTIFTVCIAGEYRMWS